MHMGYESRYKMADDKWSKWEPVEGGVSDEIGALFVQREDGTLKVSRVDWQASSGGMRRQWRRV